MRRGGPLNSGRHFDVHDPCKVLVVAIMNGMHPGPSIRSLRGSRAFEGGSFSLSNHPGVPCGLEGWHPGRIASAELAHVEPLQTRPPGGRTHVIHR